MAVMVAKTKEQMLQEVRNESARAELYLTNTAVNSVLLQDLRADPQWPDAELNRHDIMVQEARVALHRSLLLRASYCRTRLEKKS